MGLFDHALAERGRSQGSAMGGFDIRAGGSITSTIVLFAAFGMAATRILLLMFS